MEQTIAIILLIIFPNKNNKGSPSEHVSMLSCLQGSRGLKLDSIETPQATT